MDPPPQEVSSKEAKTASVSEESSTLKGESTQEFRVKHDIDMEKKRKLVEMQIQSKIRGDEKNNKYYKDLVLAHKYWDERPTLRDDANQQPGSVEGLRTVADVSKEPMKLPIPTLEWCEIDVNKDNELHDLYELLTYNYVEDDDNTFRFDYSHEFLKWALNPPGASSKWIVGIRDNTRKCRESNQLVACITGVPVHTYVEDNKIKMAEINYLCVHKEYREHKLAPTLISEVTRRVNLTNKWQAIYTSGKTLPTPFCRTTYYHRSLNPKKLIEIRFSALGPNQTIPKVVKLYSLPQELTIDGLRPMVKKDIFGVYQVLNKGLEKFKVKFHFTEEEVGHYFLPRPNIIYTYVLEKEIIDEKDNKKKKRVTDFLSFYSLPSHVMKSPKHKMLNACYSYYNFANTVDFKELINNALILAKMEGFDVYNCLNLMDNKSMLEDLLFQVGDGNLNYYIYNWVMNCRHINPEELGVVLF